MKVTPGTFCAH